MIVVRSFLMKSAYTHGSNEILENQEIQSLVYDVFKKMGFQLIQLLDSDSDGNEYYRVISRYRRYIGAGNDIELITNDD